MWELYRLFEKRRICSLYRTNGGKRWEVIVYNIYSYMKPVKRKCTVYLLYWYKKVYLGIVKQFSIEDPSVVWTGSTPTPLTLSAYTPLRAIPLFCLSKYFFSLCDRKKHCQYKQGVWVGASSKKLGLCYFLLFHGCGCTSNLWQFLYLKVSHAIQKRIWRFNVNAERK